MGALQSVIESFYSSEFYRDVAHDRRGAGFGMITLLTFILTLFILVSLLNVYPQVRGLIQQIPERASQLPAVHVEEGRLTIDKPVPYSINLGSEENPAWIVVDTNYKIADINALTAFMKQRHVAILFTGDHVVTLKDRAPDGTLEISSYGNTPITFTHDKWVGLANMLTHWGMAMITLLLLVVMFVGLFICNVIFNVLEAIVVLILGMIMGAQLDYAASMRVTAAFRMPTCIICMLPMLLGAQRLSGGAGILIWLGYLLFAVWSARPQNR